MEYQEVLQVALQCQSQALEASSSSSCCRFYEAHPRLHFPWGFSASSMSVESRSLAMCLSNHPRIVNRTAWTRQYQHAGEVAPIASSPMPRLDCLLG